MNSKPNAFPAKILLFGEYTLITGSKGLAIPFDRFHASFKKVEGANSVQSAFRLDDFYQYLKGSKILSENIDLARFEHDIKQGFYLNSNIPRGYGIGSSGALCAAVYAHYANNFERQYEYSSNELNHLKDIMALMENFYHGTSSGLDCLISLINKPILVQGRNHYEITDVPSLNSLGQFYLYDSGIERKTASFVYGFLEKYGASEKYKTVIDQHSALVGNLIHDLIEGNQSEFKKNMIELSHFQYLHFADMIPEDVKELWMTGLKTQQYFFKLCGAGGGGYCIVYADNDEFSPSKAYTSIT